MSGGAETLARALPAWNAGSARNRILDFVARVTAEGGPDFVPVEERVAVFDSDGTLWCEMPVPVQAFFVDGRLRELAPEHPEWRIIEPFCSALSGDRRAIAAQGERGVHEVGMVTHAGMTTDEFEARVRQWLARAWHPRLHLPFTRTIYQPMLEVLRLLRARGFATFITAGAGVEFTRVFAREVYGVPPHQVIGSTIRTHAEMRGGAPVLVRDAAADLADGRAAGPAALNRALGRRPIAAFGNSDGDLEMLRWITAGRTDGCPSLGVIVHHTDGVREFRYDREHVPGGRLDLALDDAPRYGWVVADVRADWKTVFPPAAEA
jgi:phosphoglycolate phosphatase-like HAD superfamily hydrolase